jgi:SulP family sulfate permease
MIPILKILIFLPILIDFFWIFADYGNYFKMIMESIFQHLILIFFERNLRMNLKKLNDFQFNRKEFAGSLGELGTLIPLSVALITINDLGFTPIFLMVGLFYLVTGYYYRLPIPIQPLKVVAAIAIAFPDKITLPVMSATGILFGIILTLLAITGAIDHISRFFTRPIVRGIQLGLGFILMIKGISLVNTPELFVNSVSMGGGNGFSQSVIPFNLIIGIGGFLLGLVFISSRRYQAALVLICTGIFAGVLLGGGAKINWLLGPTPLSLYVPGAEDYWNALILLVIPQIPLTIGNAIMGTADTSKNLFGEDQSCRVTHKSLALDMGIFNFFTGLIGAMPMCHGAGGLAAHHRFGARTGGSNLMIGIIFVSVALILGKTGISIFSTIPNAILGVLLMFAGLELALIVRDLDNKKDFFTAFLIAGIAVATKNMGIAFGLGIVVSQVLKLDRIKI